MKNPNSEGTLINLDAVFASNFEDIWRELVEFKLEYFEFLSIQKTIFTYQCFTNVCGKFAPVLNHLNKLNIACNVWSLFYNNQLTCLLTKCRSQIISITVVLCDLLGQMKTYLTTVKSAVVKHRGKLRSRFVSEKHCGHHIQLTCCIGSFQGSRILFSGETSGALRTPLFWFFWLKSDFISSATDIAKCALSFWWLYVRLLTKMWWVF